MLTRPSSLHVNPKPGSQTRQSCLAQRPLGVHKKAQGVGQGQARPLLAGAGEGPHFPQLAPLQKIGVQVALCIQKEAGQILQVEALSISHRGWQQRLGGQGSRHGLLRLSFGGRQVQRFHVLRGKSPPPVTLTGICEKQRWSVNSCPGTLPFAALKGGSHTANPRGCPHSEPQLLLWDLLIPITTRLEAN